MRTFLAVAVLALVGCTQNERARSWGGKATYGLEPGKKLVTMTWKEDDLWFLQRPMREGEAPETAFAETAATQVREREAKAFADLSADLEAAEKAEDEAERKARRSKRGEAAEPVEAAEA